MTRAEQPEPGPERREPGDRLSRLSRASLRINESLEFDTVLQVVVDSARTLTGSRYGAITVLGETEQRPDSIVSGLTWEEHQGLWDMPQGLGFFEYLSGVKTPLRVSNIAGHLGTLGMPESSPPVSASSLLMAPIRHQGVGVGIIYLAHEVEGREFSQEDEETLVMFASQAALAEENVMQVPDGRRISTIINATPTLSDEGVVESTVVTMQDIAPMKKLERRQAEFLGMVSQELLAPLTSINGSAVAVLEELTRLDLANARQFFSLIEWQADRMRA